MSVVAIQTVHDLYDNTLDFAVVRLNETRAALTIDVGVETADSAVIELTFDGPEGVDALDKMIEFLTTARNEIAR